MNSVDRVKAICKQRKIPISKLEKDLGFSNGYIGQLRKGVFPADRLMAISDYLGLSVDFLQTGENKKSSPAPEGGEPKSKKDLIIALLDEMDEEELALLLRNIDKIKAARMHD